MKERKSRRPLVLLPGSKKFWIAQFEHKIPSATVLLGHAKSDVAGLFRSHSLASITVDEIADRNLIGRKKQKGNT